LEEGGEVTPSFTHLYGSWNHPLSKGIPSLYLKGKCPQWDRRTLLINPRLMGGEGISRKRACKVPRGGRHVPGKREGKEASGLPGTPENLRKISASWEGKGYLTFITEEGLRERESPRLWDPCFFEKKEERKDLSFVGMEGGG